MDDSLILNADCTEALKDLIDKGVQVDSIVTDPPYGIRFMGMAWDGKDIEERALKRTASPKQALSANGKPRVNPRKTFAESAGTYDLSPSAMLAFQDFTLEWAQLAFKLLKPGGHLLCFASPRTYHRMAIGIEYAGFEIRDQLMWVFGSGFPKSLDVSKAIDKAAGVEREKIKYDVSEVGNFKNRDDTRPWIEEAKQKGFHLVADNNPISEDAKQWQGFGTALKPAHEPIVLARKPLDEKTIAANVLTHGTGAINIDGCRVGNDAMLQTKSDGTYKSSNCAMSGHNTGRITTGYKAGRFPANLIHDGSEEVESEFAKYGMRKSPKTGGKSLPHVGDVYGKYELRSTVNHADSGTASRFYYCAKASKAERDGSKHPTVKPLALMRYLCRLITPPGGTVLDPFAGSGTTGQAAKLEGFNYILIEKNQEYVADIERRVA